MRVRMPSAVRRPVVRAIDDFVLRRYVVLAGRQSRGEAVDVATAEALARLARRPPDNTGSAIRVDEAIATAFGALAEADRSGSRPSEAVRRTVIDEFHRLYYDSPKRTWQNTRFLGVRVLKSPLDLWIYQEMIHELRPDVLIEAGTMYGGSAYYFARLFDLVGHGQVITIDVRPKPDLPEHPRITYVTGSSTDPEVVSRVDEIAEGGKPLIVLDSNHHRDHVLEELRIWSPRVPVGSYLVVEDTHADGHPVTTRVSPGPWDAVDLFLAQTDEFEVDESRHKFFFTWNRRGYLKRVKPHHV